MELIYAYIDKYRIFHKQAFSFSNKFDVHYDSVSNALSILKNETYIDIYPGNIVGISAIVGKNATGKTSLLSLIGDRIEDRFSQHEIYEETAADPFEKLDIFNPKTCNISKQVKYVSDYFLLYYIGEDCSGNNLFIFETDNPFQYVSLIDSHNSLSDINLEGGNRAYYLEKGWASWVLCNKGSSLTFVSTTNKYIVDNMSKSIEETSSVIFFRHDPAPSLRGYNLLSEEEHRTSIKKRYALLQERWKYRQLITIQQLMQKSTDMEMFRCNQYELRVSLSDAITFFQDVEDGEIDLSDFIIDYRNYDFEDKSLPQKIILDFLEKYAQYVLSSYVNNNEVFDSESKKALCTELVNISPTSSKFNDIIVGFCKQLECIFSNHEDKDYLMRGIQSAIQSYYTFLQNSKTYGISYTYEPSLLIIEFTKESQLEKLKDFFKYTIDEPVYSALNRETSVMHKFLDAHIFPLSEGETENLALFTAIYDQVETKYPDKKHYILLFDEIERSMHPEMCRRLISDLSSFLNRFENKEFHIIIASHSPFIASDIRKENLICLNHTSKESNKNDSTENSFGQNIHTLLKKKFYLNFTFGEHTMRLINMVVDCLKAGNIESMRNLINKTLNCQSNYSFKKIPHRDDEVLPYLQQIINSIGEPLIKMQLTKMLKNWEVSHLSKEERIAQLEAQIKHLKQGKD